MKRYVIAFFIIAAALGAQAQKFAYVNTELILESMVDYADAQKQLDDMSKKWQENIELKYKEIEKMYQTYKAEQILLTEELRREREKEILEKEEEVKNYQKEKFGVNGELFKMRQKLIQPLQEQIYKALEDLSKRNGFNLIFDISGNSNILYYDARFDKTDDIIRRLGSKK
ncbi:MAG: OmpH family outer membrane protein [Flavobacteriales bacterium]|jgi:outer membrane protein|nr:OmpH family outer membrane protein [Flavobacteriales bacterium]